MEKAVTSQYRASLKMLVDVINKCPNNLWDNGAYENRFWRIVYHTLFYTALYLNEGTSQFVPWRKHIANYNYLGSVNSDNKPVIINSIYSKDEMIKYAKLIFKDCKKLIKDNDGKESGFDWLPLSRLEIHIYNIRHLQHHIGQLIERLHQSGINRIKWEGMVE
ncbi:MAG: hypothetical protein ABIO76_03105 [Ginsengibacter sp.]